MSMSPRRLAVLLLPRRCVVLLLPLLLGSTASLSAPQNFNLGSYGAPPVANRGGKPLICTVAYLVEDYASNETYAARMQFTPAADAVIGQNGRMPCPGMMPPTVSQAALQGCRDHAAEASDCVFADMSRGFDASPSVENSSDNAARCRVGSGVADRHRLLEHGQDRRVQCRLRQRRGDGGGGGAPPL